MSSLLFDFQQASAQYLDKMRIVNKYVCSATERMNMYLHLWLLRVMTSRVDSVPAKIIVLKITTCNALSQCVAQVPD